MLWWDDSLKLGVEPLDQQHKKIFDKAEEVFNLENKDREKLKKLILFLLDYVNDHFQQEENLMEKSRYPKLLEHRQRHQNLAEKLKEIIKEITDKGIREEILLEFKVLFIDWLANHITEQDKEFVEFYRKLS